MPKQKPPSPWLAYVLAGEIAYTLAVPAVLFGFGGAYLDKYLGTVPLFLILGLLLAIGASAMAIRRMIRRVSLEAERSQNAHGNPPTMKSDQGEREEEEKSSGLLM